MQHMDPDWPATTTPVELEVVDGQQRIVTLVILYAALYYQFHKLEKFAAEFDDDEKSRLESYKNDIASRLQHGSAEARELIVKGHANEPLDPAVFAFGAQAEHRSVALRYHAPSHAQIAPSAAS